MIPLRRQILLKAFRSFDLTVISFSFLMTEWIYSPSIHIISIEQFWTSRIPIKSIVFLIIILLGWYIIFSLFGFYRSWRTYSRISEIRNICKATTLGTLITLIIDRLFKFGIITPESISALWIGSSVILISSRLMLRCFLTNIRTRGRNQRYILIVGTNERAIKLSNILETNTGLGYQLLGFVDVEPVGTKRLPQLRSHIVTDSNGFISYVRDNVIDEVWIATSKRSSHHRVFQIETLCHKLGIVARYFSDVSHPARSHVETDLFDDISVISRYPSSQMGWLYMVKRLIDIFISLILLVLISPMFIVITLWIKATSFGPAFFVQQRVGFNKRRFFLYKFRTMTHNAENEISSLNHLNEASGPVFKIKNDPRITKIGKFLRKTSIDELPQLINILKGEMRLVGPRPLPIRDFEKFYRDRHYRRFSVLPGLTCLWQANGRSNISFEKWMELDLQYIDQWSLRLDFMILLKTIPSVFVGYGAS